MLEQKLLVSTPIASENLVENSRAASQQLIADSVAAPTKKRMDLTFEAEIYAESSEAGLASQQTKQTQFVDQVANQRARQDRKDKEKKDQTLPLAVQRSV
jgi:hypothetical protein